MQLEAGNMLPPLTCFNFLPTVHLTTTPAPNTDGNTGVKAYRPSTTTSTREACVLHLTGPSSTPAGPTLSRSFRSLPTLHLTITATPTTDTRTGVRANPPSTEPFKHYDSIDGANPTKALLDRRSLEFDEADPRLCLELTPHR